MFDHRRLVRHLTKLPRVNEICTPYQTCLCVLTSDAMHIRCSAILSFLLAHLCFLAFRQVSASPSALDNISSHLISARDGGHHNQHAAPLLQLNETEIIVHHAPTPPSYYTIDWEGGGSEKRHPGLLISHAVLMSLAFFLLLPVGKRFHSLFKTMGSASTIRHCHAVGQATRSWSRHGSLLCIMCFGLFSKCIIHQVDTKYVCSELSVYLSL